MERAAMSVSTSSHYGGLPRQGLCPCMIAPSANAAATSARGSSSSSCPITGLLTSEGGHEAVAGRKVNYSRFNGGSWVKSARRLDGCKVRGIGAGGASSHSFHKGILPPVRCNKMFVPGFGEKSSEAKAADSLHNFFTFVAVKIVLSQLQDYNREGYEDLMDFVDRVSLKDGDKFCANLMRESFRHKTLALRIMEVRSAYCRADFEWDNLQKLCNKETSQSVFVAVNGALVRDATRDKLEFKNFKGSDGMIKRAYFSADIDMGVVLLCSIWRKQTHV